MLPVAILPVAGILLGIGAAGFEFMPAMLSQIMENAGGAVFGNLPLLFAVCCLLFAVCCLLFAVCCLLLVRYWA